MGTLRLLLALSVAFSHFRGPFTIMDSRYAVQMFYIISGFLISMILDKKYGDRTWLFYSNRAARIFVPYWATLLITIAVCLPQKSGFAASIISCFGSFDFTTRFYLIFSNALIFGQDIGLFLGWSPEKQLYLTSAFFESKPPVWSFQAIPQAWTVGLELWFYLLAPHLLRSNSITLSLVAGSALVMHVFAFKAGFTRDPWTYRFFPFELTWFVIGALAYRLGNFKHARNFIAIMPRLLPAIAFFAALTVVLGWGRLSWISMWSYRTTLIGQPIGLLLLTAACCPLLFRFSLANQWDRKLGDLSYPIYITHYTVIWFLGSWNMAPDFGVWRNVVLTIAASLLINYGIEAPLNRWRQLRITEGSATHSRTAFET